MAVRTREHIEGHAENVACVSLMVNAIERATAAMEAAPLADMKASGADDGPALRAYRTALIKQAKMDLSAQLRASLERFDRVASRKLAALGDK